MKRVTLRRVVTEILEVPDDTPTSSIDELKRHLSDDLVSFCVSIDVHSHEIIDVQPLTTGRD